MIKHKSRFGLKIFTAIFLLFLLSFAPAESHAQSWPPFTFRVTPLHQNGQITYNLTFIALKNLTWAMRDVRINFPLPEGTRYVEGRVHAPGEVSFDGSEIHFFSPVLPNRTVKDAAFTVEVLDPSKTIYETNAWISWEGDVAGSFSTDPISINTGYGSLDWTKPTNNRLELKTVVKTEGDIATYLIYPRNVSGRMWDLRISLPFPAGTTFLSADAPGIYVVGSNEGEVVFSTIELEKWAVLEPLKVQVSTAGAGGAEVVTQLWASWKNVGRRAGLAIPAEEAIRTADIIVRPQGKKSIVVDLDGDVPFSNYDLTNVSLQEVLLPAGQGAALKLSLYAAGTLGEKEPLEYQMIFDEDCVASTGKTERYLGAESRVIYTHNNNKAAFSIWDVTTGKYIEIERIPVEAVASGNRVTLWVPYDLLQNDRDFCWMAKSRYRSTRFNPAPNFEFAPDVYDDRLMKFSGVAEITDFESFIPEVVGKASNVPGKKRVKQAAPPSLIEAGVQWRYLPGWIEPNANWISLFYDDSKWFSGPTSIGYDNYAVDGIMPYASDLSLLDPSDFDGDIPKLIRYTDPDTGAIVAIPPSGQERSVYMRRIFSIDDLSIQTELKLQVEFQDGFVAYLNGVEVARRGLGLEGDPIAFDTLALKPNKRTGFARMDISEHLGVLVEGENILAVEVHRANGRGQLTANVVLK